MTSFAVRWIANGSPTICATLLRGFSDEYGSWKMICICWRSGRSSRCERCVMSWPSKRTVPDGRCRAAARSAAPSSTSRSRTRRRSRASRRRAPSSVTSSTAWTTSLAAREHALRDREVLRQMLDLDESSPRPTPELIVTSVDARDAVRAPLDAFRQISRFCSGDEVARVGMPVRDRAGAAGARCRTAQKRYWQRGWNGQPGRRMEQRRRRALDRHEDLEAPVDRRHRLEQPPRVRDAAAR